MTAVLAIGFMALSVVLAVLSAQNASTVGGQPDPNARSIVTEQLQKERAASQFFEEHGRKEVVSAIQ